MANNQQKAPSIKDGAFINANSSEIIFESMSGVNSTIIFEFPSFDGRTTKFIKLNSIITIAYSVYRAKTPVYYLGSNTVRGFSLGNKMVAGSVIKTLTYQDDLSQFLEYYQSEALSYKDLHAIPNLGSKRYIAFKEFDSMMRDDLLPFNIYIYNISEYTGAIICDAIYGATIVNNGQVQSVENLITENTISFIAQSVRQAHDVTNLSQSIPSLNSIMTGTKLLEALSK